MEGRERWSLLDGRRRRSAQAVIDQFLDRLVDIFDFPLAPPSYNAGSLSGPPSTPRKHSAVDSYSTMDGSSSPHSRSRECTLGGGFNRPRKVSMADRLRELLLRSARSKTATRNSVAMCTDPMKSTSGDEARELHVSWRSEKNPQDDLWVERDEQDRQLQCGYQCLADEATI
ncbi:hypothetical protein PHYPSEUDO_007699 [Phytophthora pseudosyringae]|uniref:Uncharacterized protein n=1 Tax=Phytophthora pseudosyringae TaxID=221518 RepID=A0A8T1WEM6_9STRA|nr:hypothetical protein PHYPSEUDO_007699 [Phytophthora pseudosyringae]